MKRGREVCVGNCLSVDKGAKSPKANVYPQIDTLLRDITFQSPEHLPRNNSETLSSWLGKQGLSGCLSALESHGFDSLSFLGANILSMDDLEDIGIASQDDQ